MNILINQIGYTPEMKKTAVLRGELSAEMQVLNDRNQTVLSIPVSTQRSSIWGDEVVLADFTELTAPGTYHLRCGAEQSWPFTVSEAPYQTILTALVDAFYYQRCGGEVDGRVGVHAHPACHTGLARVYGGTEQFEVSGGWHDAGDYGRYIVPAAKAVADLLLAFQWNPKAFEQTNLTTLLPEIRWELEWMLKMQRADGAVWHKVTCANFCDMIMPEKETEELFLSPASTAATGDFAACMAMASRFYAEEEPDFAERMKKAAIRAWDFLKDSEPILFRNPEGISTGEYGDSDDADERLWAVVELALTCGEPYLSAAEEALGQVKGYPVSLGWADMIGYVALEGISLPGELGEKCRTWLIEGAREQLKQINSYGITMTDKLIWGSNMNISDDGMIFYMAWKLTGEESFRIGAEKQLHYLLGVNPVDYCYVSCFGGNPMMHPHHRPSAATGVCVPGLLSGGPDSGLDDEVAQEHLQGQPAGKCFIDHVGSYSTNEICIYWNSPMVALLAGLMA